MVGRPLAHEVIEPQQGQCAWPVEEGTPLDAALFFVIKERPNGPFREAMLELYPPDQYTIEDVSGLGEEAFVVVENETSSEPAFVEGLETATGQLHVVLGNGGNPDAWTGTSDEIRDRLRSLMQVVLGRIEDRVGES